MVKMLYFSKIEKNMYNAVYNILVTLNSKKVNIEELSLELNKKGIRAQEKQLYNILYYMLVVKGIVIKDDYINGKEKFKLLEPYYQRSAYQEHYEHLTVKEGDQRILLISDTHLGNESLMDLEMLQAIYHYASDHDISWAFHLGDLFDRHVLEDSIETLKMYEKQLLSFQENYPDFIKTYGILGNHDLIYHQAYQNRFGTSFDLRGLTLLNPNFYMFPQDTLVTKFGNEKIHFSHRVYLNWILPSMCLDCLEDIEKFKPYFPGSNYNISISGHVHQAFIYTALDPIRQKNNLYIGVPSTSKKNSNDTAALLMNLHYKDNNLAKLDIVPLQYINQQVREGEEFCYSPHESKQLVKKLL